MKTFDGYKKRNLTDKDYALLAGGGHKALDTLFSALSSDTTNAIKITVGGAEKSITTDTLKTSLGLGSNAYTSTAYLPLAGGTMTGLLTTTYGSSHSGIKVGNTYITAIQGLLIFQNNDSIRFGEDSWDYNVWAGLKYVHSLKTIYLGLADGSAFLTNVAQSGGQLYLPGIANIYTGNGTNLVWHAGNDGSGSGLDADLLDGKHNGQLTALYFSTGITLTKDNSINGLLSGVYGYINANNPTGAIGNNCILIAFRNSARTDTLQIVGAGNELALYYRIATNVGDPKYENWTAWRELLHSDNYTSYVNNYYWANIKISTTSNTDTNPTFGNFYGKLTARDNTAANALLHSGAGRPDSAAGDTWIFVDDLDLGNWGIKHDLPGNNINFYGNGVIKFHIPLYNDNAYSANSFEAPRFYATTTSDAGILMGKYNSTWYEIIRNHANGNVTFNACSGDAFIGWQTTNAINFLNSSGLWNSIGLGIGTTAPSYKLDISGTTRSTGRIYANEWIQFDNWTGLYSPLNNAHFYPNNATSFGQWQIRGSRNSYSGIHFGDSTYYMTIMDSGTHKGLYSEGWGDWILYFNLDNKRLGLRTSSLTGYAVTCNGDFYCKSGWLRTEGATGWYNESYGGGMYMEDTTWIRTYGGKKFYVSNSNYDAIHSAGGVYVAGMIHAYANYLKSTCNGVYVLIGPQNSSHVHYETNAGVSHWFNKRVDVNGAIWRYGTNYGMDSDGYFYAKGVYANRDGSTTIGGISLYGTTDPMTYGIAFRGTGTYGTHGYVTSANDWATYLTMNDSTTRGWIFRRGSTNVASIAGSGNMAIGQHLKFSNEAHISTNRASDYHYGYTFNLSSNGQSIGMYSGPAGEAGGVVISPDGCLIYNSSDCGYNLQVRDKDLGADLTNIATLTFGIELDGHYAWSRGGFKKNGSSDSYVLLGGGGHKTESSLSVANADKVDGYHASSLWRSDGGTWNPSANITLNASGNSQEWSFDIYRNGYTGCYWHVWDSSRGTMLQVNPDNGKVYAPYNFVGNLEGYANSAGNADTIDGEHSSAFAHIGAHNNLTASGNEFTFASSGFTGDIWINYRTAGGSNGNITGYILGNGKGGSLGYIIHTGNIGSTSVNYASYSGYSTRLDGGAIASWGTLTSSNGFSGIAAYDWGNKGAFCWAGKSGQMYMQVDGWFYLNEGRYRVLDTSDSCAKNWSYSGQSGQPAWLWGSNDGYNCYVWNPLYFNVSSSVTSNKLRYTGFDTDALSVAQTEGNISGRTGWATYLIGNHGNGSNYYHQIIAMPFWGMPLYQRLENGVLGSWYTFAMMGFNNSGYLYADHFLQNSDIRYKHNIKNRVIEITDLASLPIFDYTWKDSEEISTGTSAQAVQKIIPTLVNEEEYLTLNYSVLGTIAGITACKELINLRSEIDLLKLRIKELEWQLKIINEYRRG